MIPFLMQRRGIASGSLIAAALAVLPPWTMATSAQAPQRAPGQVPFINFPNTSIPPAGVTPQESPASAPAAKGSPKLDALQQRDRDLQLIRSEQKPQLVDRVLTGADKRDGTAGDIHENRKKTHCQMS